MLTDDFIIDLLDDIYAHSITLLDDPVFPYRIRIVPISTPPRHWTTKMLEGGASVVKRDKRRCYDYLQRAADSELKEVLASIGAEPCTRPGCWRCCRALIQIKSEAEAETVAEALRGLDETAWARVRSNAAKGKDLLDSLRFDRKDAANDKDIATGYVMLGGVCPALVDGCCVIYKNRPISCRTFSAVQPCQDDNDGAVFLIMATSQLCAQVAALTGRRNTTMVDLVLETSRLWIPR